MRTSPLCLLATLTLIAGWLLGAAPALAQDDQIDAENVDQSYVKVYMDMTGTTTNVRTPQFIMMVAVIDMVDEQAASDQMDEMLSSMAEDSDYADFQTEEVNDVGDAAIHYTALAGDSDDPQHGAIVRDGKVLFFVMTLGAEVDEHLPMNVVKHMLEKGPSDDPVEKEAEGSALSGGWVEAFPTADDFPELKGMDSLPVYDLLEDGFFGSDFTPPASDDDEDDDDDSN